MSRPANDQTTVEAMTTISPGVRQLKPRLYKDTLANGLTVLVKETPGVKVATVQIWVRAGSIYEGPHEGGITHLIEHMIFKGTKTRGPGEVAAAIEERGGQINAYTSFEQTVYHATLPVREWQTALTVLADAVLNSVFDEQELEREKLVVLEEIGMRADRPEVKFFDATMSHAYARHPYRLPVIGSRESVAAFRREDILRYLARHYRPENFTVVLVGDLPHPEALAKVAKIFSHLPAQGGETALLPEEPWPQAPRVFALREAVNQSQLALIFPIPAFEHPDTPALDVLAGVMGQGDASRLYQRLRDEQGLVYSIRSWAFTPKYPGLLQIVATLEHGQIKAAIDSCLAELARLRLTPVEERELERVKRNLESDFVFNLEKVEGQARVLGSFELLTGDPREDAYLERIRAVSVADLERVARRYCDPRRLTVGCLLPREADLDLGQEELLASIARTEGREQSDSTASLIDSYLGNVHRFTLDNGITLLVREEPQVPTVAIQAVFPGGLMAEDRESNGAFAFIADLLPKGTARMNARELSLKIADMAGDLSGFAGKNTFGLKAAFLSRFFGEGLELMAEILTAPAFDPQEADRIRPERLAALKQQRDSLTATAFVEFNRALFQEHPYALNGLGAAEAIAAFSASELRAIYLRHARPERLVLVVAGDIKASEAHERACRLFGQWRSAADALAPPRINLPAAPHPPRLVHRPQDKEQVHIVIGFIGGPTLTGPDRYALELLDTALSGQSGRLFRQLRDRQGLAYSLSSFTLLGLDTGSFGVYIGTSPDKRVEAIASLWRELERVRAEPLSAEELEKAKGLLAGHYDLGLQTNSAQALDLALSETYGLGHDFGNRYLAAIGQVTAEEVRQAAARYIQPESYVQVTVGAGE